MSRDELFRVRDEVERHARKLMVAKNANYASQDSPISNYEHAARVMGVSPALAITGRLAEQTWRLANMLRDGQMTQVDLVKATEDLQNFPALIMYARMQEMADE